MQEQISHEHNILYNLTIEHNTRAPTVVTQNQLTRTLGDKRSCMPHTKSTQQTKVSKHSDTPNNTPHSIHNII